MNYRTRFLVGAAGLAALVTSAPQARATWSIVLIDTRTGEVGVASATCLTDFNLQNITPVLINGVGAATAQSFGDTTQQNRTFLRDKLALGVAPATILAGLATFDSTHQTRQYGMGDTLGRTVTFSGTQNGQWAGGQTGSFDYDWAGKSGTIFYAIQGNVLTGAVVVQAAVDAAAGTNGDLPQRLMAAMQAARFAGGDGRCSCDGPSPTSCGPTPPSFTKSAHIGYILIARAGDRDASHGVYRTGANTSNVSIGDLDGQGPLDMVCTNASGGTQGLAVLTNVTPRVDSFPVFNQPLTFNTGSAPSAVAIADFTSDSIPDVIVSNRLGNNVSLFRGSGGGALLNPSTFGAGTNPQAMVIADFDGLNGPDFAVAGAVTGAITVRRSNGNGTFQAAQTFPVGLDPRSLVAADFNSDGRPDLAVALRGAAKIVMYSGNGDGTFTAMPEILTPAFPTALVAANFDGDTDIDLAVADQSNSPGVTILLNNAGTFAATTHPVTPFPTDLAVGDITGDGVPDLVAPQNSTSFTTFEGGPLGVFTPAGPVTVGFLLSRVALGDVDGDGDLDAAFTLTNPPATAVVENRGQGDFDSGVGTAFGDYFLSFNVPNQSETSPDPVAQLQGMFDTWRAALDADPDAVQSDVTSPTGLIAGSPHTGVMTMALRDWQGDAVTGPIASVTVVHAPGSAGATTIGAVTDQGGGIYTAEISPTATVGVDRYLITADNGVRPVVLMPNAAVTISPCPADFDRDGDTGTDSDIEAFFSCLGGDCCPACGSADVDLDGDTGTDADIEYFFLALGGAIC